MIPDVEIKQLQTHTDERGFFCEIIRSSDSFFDTFAQWSHSYKRDGYYTEQFHIHQNQIDWWYVPVGTVIAVLADMRQSQLQFHEFKLQNQVLKIPPNVAHGFKVTSGPAHLMYITSQEYNPADEGRIDLPFDWSKIK